MEQMSKFPELNYMTQIVIMLFEDVSQPEDSEQRYRVEVHFSPGVKGRLELLQKGYNDSKEIPLGASSSTSSGTKSSLDEVSKSSMWVKRLPVNVELLVDDVIRQGHLGSKSAPNMSPKTSGLGRSLKSASEGQLQKLRSPKWTRKGESLDSHSQVLSILQDDDGEAVASKSKHFDSRCGTIPEHISILQDDDEEEVASKREHLDSRCVTIPEHIFILQQDDGEEVASKREQLDLPAIDTERRGGKVTEEGSKTRVQVSSQLSESSTCHSDNHLDLVTSGGGTYSDGSHHSLKEIGM